MKLTKGKISKAIRKKKQSMKKYKRKNVKKSGTGKAKTFRKRKGTNLLKSTLKNYGLIGGTHGDLFETQDGPLLGNYKVLSLTPEKVKGNPKFKFIEAYDGKADIKSEAAIRYMQDNRYVDPSVTSDIEMQDMSKGKNGPLFDVDLNDPAAITGSAPPLPDPTVPVNSPVNAPTALGPTTSARDYQVGSPQNPAPWSTGEVKARNAQIIAAANAKANEPDIQKLAEFLKIDPNSVATLLQFQDIEIPGSTVTAESIKTFSGLLDYAMTAQKPAWFTQSWTLNDPYGKKAKYQIGATLPKSDVKEITPSNLTDLLVDLCCDSNNVQAGARKLTSLASYWVEEGDNFQLISPVQGGKMKTTNPGSLFVSFDDGKIFIMYGGLRILMSTLLPSLQKLMSKKAKMAYFDKSGNENTATFASAEKIKAGTKKTLPLASAITIDGQESYAGYIRYLLERTSNVVINYSPVYYLLVGDVFQKQIGKTGEPGDWYFSFDGRTMIKDDDIPENLRYKYDDLFLWLASPIPPILPRAPVVNGRGMSETTNAEAMGLSQQDNEDLQGEPDLNAISVEGDSSDVQQEISDLKQQIVKLQKQANRGSSSGSASDTSSFGLSEGQINALEGMEGFQPSNMVAFLKTFMILIATIIKLNDSNAGGNGDLKQAMSILASGLKPETVDSLGGVVDSAGDTSAASVKPSVASSSGDSVEPDNSNQSNSAGDEVIRLTEEISNKKSEFKERLDAFNSAEQAIENMPDTDPDYTDLKNKLEEASLELSKLSKKTIQFVTDQESKIEEIFAAAEGLDLPENQKFAESLEDAGDDIDNLSQVVESKDPSFLQKQENEASEIAAEIKSNSSNLKDSVLQNGANVVSGLLQLAALGLHSLSLAVVPNETKSNSVPQVQPDIQPQVQPDPALLTAPVPDPSEPEKFQETEEEQLKKLKESMEGGKEKKNKKRKSKTKKTNKKSSKSKRSKKNNSKKNKSK